MKFNRPTLDAEIEREDLRKLEAMLGVTQWAADRLRNKSGLDRAELNRKMKYKYSKIGKKFKEIKISVILRYFETR